MANVTNMELDLGGIFLQNDSYDYGDYVYVEDGCPSGKGMRFDAVFLPVLYSLALVLGLLGNVLVLLVLAQKRQNWSVTDIFILHLGIADTLLLLTLPLWAAQAAQGWSFGTPLCKITGAMFTINFYCGIFLLACISLDRYLSIVHAVQMYSRRKPRVVQASCLSVWLISLLLSIPDWLFLESVYDDRRNKEECVHNYPSFSKSSSDWRLASRLLYHTMGFLLPSAVLIFCYTCILLRLQRGSQGLQKQRAIRVILPLVLVLVFLICWTPFNITLMVDTFRGRRPPEPGAGSCDSSRTALENSLIVTTSLCFLHACLNPLLYFCLCGNFQRLIRDKLRFVTGVQANIELSLWDSGVTEEPSLQQAEEKGPLNMVEMDQLQATQSCSKPSD